MSKRIIESAASLEWTVEFAVIPAGKQAGDETEHVVTVWAESSFEALVEAARSLRSGLAADDLIRYVHVRRPRKSKPE